LPGNLWGPANNASNVLVRPLPETKDRELEISVTVENHPTEQYEQADLAWYYDDGHMVKLGQELVDGKLSVVMGREEDDHTRTIAILPLKSSPVRLRLLVKDSRIRGEFQLPGQDHWTPAGECDLPAKGEAKASLQVYQGPRNVERWARFTEFRVVRRSP
jgi:regulation of enolase protein 1 (concanavalin A-like superfamily)